MLSLQLVSELQAGSNLVTPFQPWWEVLIDYSLYGILLAVLLGLAGVTLTGTSEIVCIPLFSINSTDLSIVSYVNARCSRRFGGSFLLYYPYIALILYLILLFGHVLSVKLPSTASFLERMFNLFADFKTLQNSSSYYGRQAVVTNPEEQRMSDETEKGGKFYKTVKAEFKEQVVALVERLIATLASNPGFFVVYVVKSVILFVGSSLVIAGNVISLLFYDWMLVFDCELTDSVALIYQSAKCTVPAAPFLYGLMMVIAIFSAFIMLLTFRAMFWLYQTRNFQAEYLATWKEREHVLGGEPGFRDFLFCLMLMKNNGTDGEAVYNTVNSSLKIYDTLKFERHFDLSFTVASDIQFERDNYICNYMLQELGMRTNEKGESHGLIDTLSIIYSNIKGDAGSKEEAENRLRKALINELVSHPTRYKDAIDNYMASSLSFYEYVKSIEDVSFRSGVLSECNFVLIAFANLTRSKIVVLRPHVCSFVYSPICNESELTAVRYLKHLPPRDYIAASAVEEPSEEQVTNRNRFLNDAIYTKKLRFTALSSWKSVGSKKYLDTLTAMLPKYLTGTEEIFDKEDGSPINRPVSSPIALLNDILHEDIVEDEMESGDDDGSMGIEG